MSTLGDQGAIERIMCMVCHQRNQEETMLLCDGCDHGYHMACLSPPLNAMPSGRWYCKHKTCQVLERVHS